jgi:regulator of RNase E activity RraA
MQAPATPREVTGTLFLTTMSTVSLLREFSSCEISDALIKLGSPHGGYIPDIKMISSGTICGKSYTVKMVFASNEEAPKLAEHFVDTVTKDSVIVIDAPSGT